LSTAAFNALMCSGRPPGTEADFALKSPGLWGERACGHVRRRATRQFRVDDALASTDDVREDADKENGGEGRRGTFHALPPHAPYAPGNRGVVHQARQDAFLERREALALQQVRHPGVRRRVVLLRGGTGKAVRFRFAEVAFEATRSEGTSTGRTCKASNVSSSVSASTSTPCLDSSLIFIVRRVVSSLAVRCGVQKTNPRDR
jgi:hypothetical protein